MLFLFSFLSVFQRLKFLQCLYFHSEHLHDLFNNTAKFVANIDHKKIMWVVLMILQNDNKNMLKIFVHVKTKKEHFNFKLLEDGECKCAHPFQAQKPLWCVTPPPLQTSVCHLHLNMNQARTKFNPLICPHPHPAANAFCGQNLVHFLGLAQLAIYFFFQ